MVLLQAPSQGEGRGGNHRRRPAEEGPALSGDKPGQGGEIGDSVRQTIQGYGNGGFTVLLQRYEGPIAILPFHTQAWDAPADPSQLSERHLQPILDELAARPDGVEIVLLGLGKGASVPPAVLAPLRARLKALGASLDGMDTGAACRTFNLLVGESRRVAALLIPV